MVKKLEKPFFHKSVLFWLIVLCVILLAAFTIKYFLNMHKKNNDVENYSDKETLKIVYVYSESCPHCIKFENTFDVKSREFARKTEEMDIDIAKIEKSSIPTEYEQYVDGFPTVLIFKNDKFMKKTVGNMNGSDFMNQLQGTI